MTSPTVTRHIFCVTVLLLAPASSSYLPTALGAYHPTYLKYALFQTAVALAACIAITHTPLRSGPPTSARPWTVPMRTVLAAFPSCLALLLYVGASLLSILWSDCRAVSAMSCFPLVFYAAWAVLIVSAMSSKRDGTSIAQSLVLAGVLAALIGLGAYVAGLVEQPDRLRYAGYRLMKPFGNPTFMACFLLLPMLLTVAHVRAATGWRFWARLAALALMLVALSLTRSESGLVGLLAGIVVYVLLLQQWNRRRAAIALGSASAGLAVILACLPLWWPRVMSAAFNPESTLHARAFLWQTAWTMFKEHPWLGWGSGAFISNAYRFLPPDANLYPYVGIGAPLSGLINHVHNEIVEIAVETGLVGLTIFLAFIGIVFVRAARLARATPDGELRATGLGLLAGAAAMLVESCGDVALRFWDVAPFFWTALGLLMAIGSSAPGADGPQASSVPQPSRPRPAFLTALLILAAAVWWLTCGRPYQSQVCLANAEGMVKRGNDAGAVPLYRRAIATGLYHVDYVRSHLLLGTCLARLQRYEEAGAVLEKLQALAPNYHRSRLYLGDIYLRLGRVPSAMDSLRIYHSQNPYDPAVYLRLAIGHRELGQSAQAEEMLQKGLKLAPNNAALQQEMQALRAPQPSRP
ncbi:MAG: tetratricopeptide repeat protein [Planctomycetes bacterium]|nr:tetratricopeptide repeat protein [Planctomycetota bacterium]